MARFCDAYFLATHNSYEAKRKMSIFEQLDLGVRGLELDLNLDDFAGVGDFQIGHEHPGTGVLLGDGKLVLEDRPPTAPQKANPTGLLFADWVKTLEAWSSARGGTHAALVVYLDLKDELADGAPGTGGLQDLDKTIEDVWGGRIFTPADLGAARDWPEADDLKGRVLFVVSGNLDSRVTYASRPLAQQVAFVELQPDDIALLLKPKERTLLQKVAGFYAESNMFGHGVTAHRAANRVTRVWSFGVPHDWPWGNASTRVVPSFPAVDDIRDLRYLEFARDLAAADVDLTAVV